MRSGTRCPQMHALNGFYDVLATMAGTRMRYFCFAKLSCVAEANSRKPMSGNDPHLKHQ